MASLPGQQWQVMGFDVRELGHYLLRAWRDLLFASDSPVRSRLDEPVAVDWRGATLRYQGLRPQAGDADGTRCSAICLDASLYLVRRFVLPLSARPDLDGVLAREVAAHSPFSGDDTCFGWRILRSDDEGLAIALCIAARSAVVAALAQAGAGREARTLEVWAEVDGEPVVIAGFGEHRRDAIYRKRLLRAGALLAGAVLSLLAATWVYAAGRLIELHRLEATASELRSRAERPLAARERLAEANALIAAAQALGDEQGDPHRELARLTKLLPDGAFLAHFAQDGTELRIRGQADNAAAVMETLAADGAYADVTAPQAITRVGRTDREQFYLDLRAGPGGAGTP